jgi:hypothetical protein
MISENLNKIITSFIDIEGSHPESQDAIDIFNKQISDLIFLANHIFIGEIKTELNSSIFMTRFNEEIQIGNESVEQGYSCFINELGQFVVEKDSKEEIFDLLSPKFLLTRLIGKNTVDKEQSVLAELLIAEEMSFILLNLAARMLK